MPRPKPPEKRISAMIRVPQSLHMQMRDEAQAREISYNRAVQFAIEHWLKSKHENRLETQNTLGI